MAPVAAGQGGVIESVARFYGAKKCIEVEPGIDVYHVPYIDEWGGLGQVNMDLRPCLIPGIKRLVYDPFLKVMVYELEDKCTQDKE